MLSSEYYTIHGKKIEVCRASKLDSNGNPRYIIHFRAFAIPEDVDVFKKYDYVCKIAKPRGFRRYSNKQYGGGLIFTSYNVQEDLEIMLKGLI